MHLLRAGKSLLSEVKEPKDVLRLDRGHTKVESGWNASSKFVEKRTQVRPKQVFRPKERTSEVSIGEGEGEGENGSRMLCKREQTQISRSRRVS